MKTFKTIYIFWLLFVLTAVDLYSQNDQIVSQLVEQDNSKTVLELDEVSVSPYRYNTDPWRVGATVHVITSDDIERLGTPPLRKILDTVPGIRTTANGIFSTIQSIFVRGLASSGNKIFVDGIEQSYGGSSALFYLKPEEIERIEVISGGAATFYGADAFGAVVNVITKKVHAKPIGVDFNFEGGSFATFKESLRIHGYFKGFTYSIFGLREDSQGLSKAKNTNDNVRFDDDRFENTDLSFRLGYEDKNYRLWVKSRYQSVFSEYDTGAFTDGQQYVEEEHLYNDAYWSHDIGEIYQYILAYNYHRSDVTNDNPTFLTLSTKVITHRHAGYFQNNLVFPWFRAGVGADFFTEELVVTNNSTSNYKVGVYLDLSRDVGKYVNFSAGVRYDIYQDYDNQLSYRASVASTYGDFKLAGSYGRAVRSPTLSELQFTADSIRLRQQIGNLWDTGLSYWNKKLDLIANITYFNNDIQNEIVYNNSIFSYDNNNFQSQGIELSFQYKPLSWLTTKLDYTFTSAEEHYTNHQALKRPEHQGNLNLNAVPLAGLNINANLAYVGETYDFGSVLIDDYFKLDLNLSYQINPLLTPYIRLENILNEDYETSSGYSEPGFSAYGGLRFRY